ncbi:hypothetical protein L2E82_17141 [Cichorium intybus]|uniref:Uncharacterized protein n=1 Tax=Cichorium intybus TaxID=13427 RepID=A0ACB9F854_CICIN|nr:hypothetical protein L2E82_17141 [Cichorium intybus]
MLPNCSSTNVYRSSSSNTTLLRILQFHLQIRLMRSLLLLDGHLSVSLGKFKNMEVLLKMGKFTGITSELGQFEDHW